MNINHGDKNEVREERPVSKIAKRFVSIVATLVMVATMVPTASVAFAAQNASASKAASTSSEIGAVYGAKELTAKTHSITESGAYYVAKDTNINPGTESGNGIKIEENLEVLIYIPAGLTLTVTGVNGYGADGEGCAAIYLPETSKLTISGGGTINAIGGNAAAGGRGGDGAAAICDEESSGGPYYSAGWGGKGGDGGAGAGAGIGTNGGKGGKGGDGGAGKNSEGFYSEDGAGEDGEDGEDGSAAEKPGQVFFAGSLTVNCQGGQTSTTKATGGKGNANHMRKNSFFAYTTCGGAGGGAGASGEAAYGIGSGGNGGAGGGGGGGGGHYRDGVGGSSYIGYYYCGGEGGAGAQACEGAASGEDGTATEDISDKLGTKYTSKGGLAGISTEGSTKSDVIDYRNTSTGKKCTYKFDRKDNSLVNVMTDSTVQSFISDEGYTTQYTIKSNGGTYGGTATEYTV